MSKSHGKSEPLCRPEEDGPSTSGVTPASFRIADWAVALGIAALAAAYFGLFFSASRARLLVASYVLMPDELVSQWADGNWSRAQFLDRMPILLFAAAILVGCYFLGRIVLVATRWDGALSNLERIVFSIGIGLHLQSLMTLFLGLTSLLISPLVFVLPWMISAGSLLVLWRRGKLRNEPDTSANKALIRTEEVPASPWERAATWSLRIYIALCFAAILLGAMLPTTDFDVREYHLQVPKEWHELGRVSFLPHNVYGNMPLGAELHSLTATQLMPPVDLRWWWGALTGKLIMASYGPLTSLAIYALGRRFLSPLAGLVAAAIYLSSPWVAHISINGLNEVVLGYYLLTAVFALLIAPRSVRSVVVAGILAGAAASCKYTGVVFVVVPVSLLAFAIFAGVPRGSFPKGFACAAALLAVSAMSCGLWYGKNWMFTGNPTYPLLYNLFDGKTWTSEKNARWTEAHKPRAFSWENLWESTQDVLWKSNFDDPLSVPLATLGIVGIAGAVRTHRRNRDSSKGALLGANFPLVANLAMLAFVLTAWWCSTHRLVRFLVPAFPLVAVLAGSGVECARKIKRLPYVVAGMLAVGLTYNLFALASPFVGDNRWFVALGKLRFDEPETDGELSRVKKPHRWLNAHIQAGDAVLCVGDAAVFDLEMPVFYNTCFDDCLLVNWTKGRTTAERKEEFRRRKIAYVCYDSNEYERYISPGNYGYDPRFSPKLLDELVNQGVLKPPLPNVAGRIYPVAP